MADHYPVALPDFGCGGEVPTLSAWFVEEGERVAAGEPLCEVGLPGMTCDLPSPITGTVARIFVTLDTPVEPGTLLAWLQPDTSPEAADGEPFA